MLNKMPVNVEGMTGSMYFTYARYKNCITLQYVGLSEKYDFILKIAQKFHVPIAN